MRLNYLEAMDGNDAGDCRMIDPELSHASNLIARLLSVRWSDGSALVRVATDPRSSYTSLMTSFPSNDMALTTILVVKDISAAKEFYIDVLGAELYGEYGGTSVVLQFLGNWLLLVTSGPPTPDKPTVAFSPPPDPDAVSHAFTIRVSDCEGCYATLSSRGANFLTPPRESDSGAEIRAFFRDPDGHLFEISQLK